MREVMFANLDALEGQTSPLVRTSLQVTAVFRACKTMLVTDLCKATESKQTVTLGGILLFLQNNISRRHFKRMPRSAQKLFFNKDCSRSAHGINKLIRSGNSCNLVLQMLGCV